MTTEDSGIPAATAEDHPDAELLRLAGEIADAWAAAATDEKAESVSDLTHELAEMPAYTPDGLIAKLDEYQRIQEGSAKSVWDDDLLRTIREGLERMKPSTDADAERIGGAS